MTERITSPKLMIKIRSKLLKIIEKSPAEELFRSKGEYGEYYLGRQEKYCYRVYRESRHQEGDEFSSGYGYYRSGWALMKGSQSVYCEDGDSKPWDLIVEKVSPLLERVEKEKKTKELAKQTRLRKQEEDSIEIFLKREE